MTRIAAVINQKGGVGKTTTVANVAAALAAKELPTLVIDLDPQAHLTIHLGADADPNAAGVYETLTGQVAAGQAIQKIRPFLDILSANIHLVGAESELVNEVGREIILQKAIEPIAGQYAYILIDCPPSLGLLTLNALALAKEVIIPVQPHFLALQGLSRLLQTVELVQQRINPELKVSAILMCMFDSRLSLSNEVRADIDKFLAAARGSGKPWSCAQVAPVAIRRNVKLAEAPSFGKTIFEYESSSNGAADYLAVAEWLHNGCLPAQAACQNTE